jgi:hypothetical protein
LLRDLGARYSPASWQPGMSHGRPGGAAGSGA